MMRDKLLSFGHSGASGRVILVEVVCRAAERAMRYAPPDDADVCRAAIDAARGRIAGTVPRHQCAAAADAAYIAYDRPRPNLPTAGDYATYSAASAAYLASRDPREEAHEAYDRTRASLTHATADYVESRCEAAAQAAAWGAVDSICYAAITGTKSASTAALFATGDDGVELRLQAADLAELCESRRERR